MASDQAAAASRAFLVALTVEAKIALVGQEAELTSLPFRVGRESRARELAGKNAVGGLRQPGNRPINDLFLMEGEKMMNVSREHFQIDRAHGGFVLEDRGSTLGTIVEGQRVGGSNEEGRITLNDGDVIIVGASVSPYVFKFRVR